VRWLAVVLIVVAACRTNDPSFRNRAGERLSDLDPLPYRVAIAKIDSQNVFTGEKDHDSEGNLWFTFNDRGVQEFFVAVLGRDPAAPRKYRVKSLNTFNETLSVTSIKLDDAIEFARKQQADLLIVPRLVEKPMFGYKRINGRWPTATLLWFTYIGGFFVQDREYHAILSFDFDIINPHDGTSIATFTAASRSIDADLRERMDKNFRSAQSVWKMFLPSYWVPDNKTVTSRSTTSRVCARLAAQLTGFLKEEYSRQARSLTGTLHRVGPRNGSRPKGDSFTFRAEVVGEQPITDVAVYINGESAPLAEWRDDVDPSEKKGPVRGLKDVRDQARGNVYGVDIEVDDLSCGDTELRVRVEFAINGRYASQTFVYLPPKKRPDDQ